MLVGIDIERLTGKRQDDAPPFPAYTLDQLQQLASTYIEQLPAPVSRLSVQLTMSAWLKWMEKREREGEVGNGVQ